MDKCAFHVLTSLARGAWFSFLRPLSSLLRIQTQKSQTQKSDLFKKIQLLHYVLLCTTAEGRRTSSFQWICGVGIIVCLQRDLFREQLRNTTSSPNSICLCQPQYRMLLALKNHDSTCTFLRLCNLENKQ